MLDDLAEALFRGLAGIFRGILWLFTEAIGPLLELAVEVVLEFGCRRPGYWILRYGFRRQNVSPNGNAAFLMGLFLWILLILLLIWLLRPKG